MTHRRHYVQADPREKWTNPFFKTLGGFCPSYSIDELTNLVSRMHGLSLNQERQKREKAIGFMWQAGQLLLLPYTTISTAIVYFHRFFIRQSILTHNSFDVACACLFIAGKQEETRLKLIQIAQVLYHYQSNDANHTHSHHHHQPFNDICIRLEDKELLITQMIEYNFTVDLPFDWLLPIAIQWSCMYPMNKQILKQYCKIGWIFVKESLYLPLFCIIPVQHIAIACMEISLRHFYHELNTHDIKLQSEYYSPPLKWFMIFDSSLDLKYIEILVQEILDISHTDLNDNERLINRRKDILLSDALHESIIERNQNERNRKRNTLTNICKMENDAYLQNNDGLESIMRDTLTNIACKTWLANTQSISPASLNPKKYFLSFPLHSTLWKKNNYTNIMKSDQKTSQKSDIKLRSESNERLFSISESNVSQNCVSDNNKMEDESDIDSDDSSVHSPHTHTNNVSEYHSKHKRKHMSRENTNNKRRKIDSSSSGHRNSSSYHTSHTRTSHSRHKRRRQRRQPTYESNALKHTRTNARDRKSQYLRNGRNRRYWKYGQNANHRQFYHNPRHMNGNYLVMNKHSQIKMRNARKRKAENMGKYKKYFHKNKHFRNTNNNGYRIYSLNKILNKSVPSSSAYATNPSVHPTRFSFRLPPMLDEHKSNAIVSDNYSQAFVSSAVLMNVNEQCFDQNSSTFQTISNVLPSTSP